MRASYRKEISLIQVDTLMATIATPLETGKKFG